MGTGYRKRSGLIRRFMISVMVVGVVLTIAAIVRPVSDSGHRGIHAHAQSAVAALVADNLSPATDEPEIGLAGGDLTHIPAGLISSDVNDWEFTDPAAVPGAPVPAFDYRTSTWLKGYDPPP